MSSDHFNKVVQYVEIIVIIHNKNTINSNKILLNNSVNSDCDMMHLN